MGIATKIRRIGYGVAKRVLGANSSPVEESRRINELEERLEILDRRLSDMSSINTSFVEYKDGVFATLEQLFDMFSQLLGDTPVRIPTIFPLNGLKGELETLQARMNILNDENLNIVNQIFLIKKEHLRLSRAVERSRDLHSDVQAIKNRYLSAEERDSLDSLRE